MKTEMGSVSRRVVDLLGLRSVARIDFLLTQERLWLNEVNTIPGSLATYLWIDPPRTREELLEAMVAEALSSPVRSYSTAGSDGTALRSASTIASKLG